MNPPCACDAVYFYPRRWKILRGWCLIVTLVQTEIHQQLFEGLSWNFLHKQTWSPDFRMTICFSFSNMFHYLIEGLAWHFRQTLMVPGVWKSCAVKDTNITEPFFFTDIYCSHHSTSCDVVLPWYSPFGPPRCSHVFSCPLLQQVLFQHKLFGSELPETQPKLAPLKVFVRSLKLSRLTVQTSLTTSWVNTTEKSHRKRHFFPLKVQCHS